MRGVKCLASERIINLSSLQMPHRGPRSTAPAVGFISVPNSASPFDLGQCNNLAPKGHACRVVLWQDYSQTETIGHIGHTEVYDRTDKLAYHILGFDSRVRTANVEALVRAFL